MSVTEEVLEEVLIDREIDRERAERIDGEWVDKPGAAQEHSGVARRVEAELRKRYRHVGRTEREVSFRLGEDVLIPDVAVFVSSEEPPLLFVEVRSPGQRISTGLNAVLAGCGCRTGIEWALAVI